METEAVEQELRVLEERRQLFGVRSGSSRLRGDW
jgi:hypothetical protein